jgi:ABC-type uncharacterized transport system ATPase subunit
MSSALLDVRGLRKHFIQRKGFPRPRTITVRAVEDVSFAIAPGEIFGIAGVEGNGQTELVEAIAGLRPVARGQILLGGGATPDGVGQLELVR